MPTLDFTFEQLDGLDPIARAAILAMYRRQREAAAAERPGIIEAAGLKVVSEKTPEDLAKEFQAHYKDGSFLQKRLSR